MTKIKPGITSSALLLAFVTFFGVSQTALAAPCTDQVNALKTALNNDVCEYSKKCKGLSHKLDSVNRKLEKGDFRKALRKLEDFGATVEDMAMRKKKRKIDPDTYNGVIVPPYGNAWACIANGGVVVVADPIPEEPVPPVVEPIDNPFNVAF